MKNYPTNGTDMEFCVLSSSIRASEESKKGNATFLFIFMDLPFLFPILWKIILSCPNKPQKYSLMITNLVVLNLFINKILYEEKITCCKKRKEN